MVTEQLARDRSNQKSGGSSYRRMRPVGLPEGVAEGRDQGRGGEEDHTEYLHGRRNWDFEDRRRARRRVLTSRTGRGKIEIEKKRERERERNGLIRDGKGTK